MKNSHFKEVLKATILSCIVAFLLLIVICGVVTKLGKDKFLQAIDFVSMMTITDEQSEEKPSLEIVQDFGKEILENPIVLTNPPTYGAKYGTLKIPSIELEHPIFYGTSLDLLKNGIGHDNDSYFPGEGGSIIMMGHNYNRLLGKLPKAKIGDSMQIHTEYGDFEYTIYDTQIVEETETEKLPIQDKEEILMLYTCWPINNVGYTTQRYVVYAKKM